MDITPIVITWIALAIIPAIAADSRGRSGGLWFIGGLLFSPLIALIVVLVLPNEREPSPVQLVRAQDPEPPFESDRGSCPRCGESIPLVAAVCRFCNLDLVTYDEEVLGDDGRGDR